MQDEASQTNIYNNVKVMCNVRPRNVRPTYTHLWLASFLSSIQVIVDIFHSYCLAEGT
jgi:hypothetical protein